MAVQQPNMDALNKTAKKQKTNNPNANPEMAKRISSLYKHWQKLWFRSSERHRQLLEARTRLKDIALARSFNFDNWRKRFNGWVDQQKLRVNDLFRRFDGNHDGMLTREEFMKALRASGESKFSIYGLLFFKSHSQIPCPFHLKNGYADSDTGLCCVVCLIDRNETAFLSGY